MKTYFTSFYLAMLTAIPGYADTQSHLIDSIVKKSSTFPPYLSWELQLGSSFLSNTALSVYSISGNYYISELFKSVNGTPTKSFSLLAGIGFLIHH